MYYQINKETQKLELIFSKEEYLALPADMKSAIKSNFLFSRAISGWVSRAKFPNLYNAERIAKAIGAEDRGKVGETLSYEEQMERKAERAEARADRMEYKAKKATERGEALQKPINDMRGDIAFFTQPNISTSSGRAFTNRRNKMFEAYDRGFEEFKKSAYYSECANRARATAEGTRPTDKGFCERRIAEAQKNIRAQQKNLKYYNECLKLFEEGKAVTRYTREEVERWIENAEELIEQAISKEVYYRECIESAGGIQYSRDNIKAGYIVKINRWGLSRVLSTGPKFFTFVDATGRSNIPLKASYGEILEVVKAEEDKPKTHPFKVGDEFTVDLWHDSTRKIDKTVCKIVKATEKTVTVLDTITGKTSVRTPKIREGYLSKSWAFFMDDNYNSGCFRRIEA